MFQLDNLTKIYKMGRTEVVALQNINLDIGQGEMVSITGPSGSGKSTLMNILGCLDTPTSGKYFLEGIDVGSLNDDQLAEIRNGKIGFVFQSFNLLPKITALDNVEMPLIYSHNNRRRENREKALHNLEAVGIAHRANHKPNEMSGGEQQRVAIARALTNNPSVILADEPTGNLDSRTSKEIMFIFQQLQQKGITVLLVTHEIDIAAYAQRTINMRDGQIEKIS
jgi:putative ABC transport system ATP-binding protein